ncbi:EAL domain-containing response regulator [Nitrosomonas sp.]|uniref:EAL domain-containing response regulator n=1 Tax=Nitrosomonas sp. TaxID=42353 RepID=UPI0026271003|nr:EAL domain-containing response regulator [Nitrosomonas sp.]MCW5600785.1 EAL domain-containing response regulator [Nitrosomonas sp.]
MDQLVQENRLLVLDDDASVGFTICAIAERVGFEVRSTVGVDEFFALLDTWQPTHIIVDLVMPDIDGVDALRRLAELDCRATIIVASGVGARVLDAASRAAVEHGLTVAGVLSKPFTPRDLRALLMVKPPPSRGYAEAKTTHDPIDFVEVTEEMLQAALEGEQFNVYYQPKIHCASGALAGMEGLVRWVHPEHGLIMPNRFMALAEESGLIGRMTIQIFEQAFAWLAAHFQNADITLSLNVSAKSLDDPKMASWIAGLCVDYGIDPSRIILEITETSTMADPVAMLDLLTQFRLKGFHLSIDDFGVGYSSLIQLARLPFSELKIDKMFVISAPASEESRKITTAILGLAHNLGLRVTAEGVEDDWTLNFLCEIGCDHAQGHYIARAMKGQEFLTWLQNRYQ